MSLVNHPSSKTEEKPKRTLLTRGSSVETKNQVSRNEIINPNKNTISKNKEHTYVTNIRVDNHIRNQISALLNLGLGSSAKEIIESMISLQLDQLDSGSLKRFNDMVEILEQMDRMKKGK